ncbi:MAG: putative serine protease HtrA [Calditrichaeota bacterium]|nr:putative serine protease HtrA [Calditrichota bacterium]
MVGRLWRWFVFGFLLGAGAIALVWLGVSIERSRWEAGLSPAEEARPLAGGDTLVAGAAPDTPAAAGEAEPAQSAPREPVRAGRENAITSAIRRAAPAVVGITVTQVREFRSRSPLYDDPFFRYFFNLPERRYRQRVENIGSGFILDRHGYIATNEHVVHGATEIMVSLTDGRSYKADLIGTDYDTDLALLKIDAENLPTLPVANHDDLIVGEWVVSIGNPFGLFRVNDQPSVSVGVISALGRNFERQETGRLYRNMVQTDAAINPGNSGGPLINLDGEAVGVNTFIFTGGGSGSIGIGFAIPASTVNDVIEQLRLRGEIERDVWTGIAVQNLDRLVAMSLGYPSLDGVIVTDVEPGSPGDRAGMKTTDIIVAINGIPVEHAGSIRQYFLNHDLRVGDEIEFRVFRNGDTHNLTLTLEAPEG